MSDMLQKLLGVEKTAAAIVAEAEAEAGRLATEARQETQQRHVELLKAAASRSDQALADERARLASERESRIQAERERLEKLPLDAAAFRTAALSFIPKGKE